MEGCFVPAEEPQGPPPPSHPGLCLSSWAQPYGAQMSSHPEPGVTLAAGTWRPLQSQEGWCTPSRKGGGRKGPRPFRLRLEVCGPLGVHVFWPKEAALVRCSGVSLGLWSSQAPPELLPREGADSGRLCACWGPVAALRP